MTHARAGDTYHKEVIIMRKHRNIALLTALLCLTSAALTACGSKESYETNGDYRVKSDMALQDGGLSYEMGAAEMYVPEMEHGETYAPVTESGFILTADQPLSTFSADVDTASYANVRRMLREGSEVPHDAVRIEEMINYFSYDYPAPTDGNPLSVTTELYDCPWNEDNALLLVGLQAEKIDLSDRKPMDLVFLIDVSGSMYSADKLPLVQRAVSMLAEELDARDRISIVTYAGSDSVVLEGVPGDQTAAISDAIYSLTASGSTNGEQGIQRAYEIAEANYIEGGIDRVILMTDGDLNVGISDPDALTKLVEEKRESGVSLSVLGFGTGNIRDDNMEALADHGNGNYAYIDTPLEARKVLVQEMGGTLYTVAKDVKLQMAFDPDYVEGYRLIGYENRLLEAEDFENDAVDAGEIGSGHSVTALYELVMDKTAADDEGASFAKVSMRWKAPDADTSELYEQDVFANFPEKMPKNLAFAAAVAEFGMLTGHRTPYGACYDQIKSLLAQTDLQDAYRQEFAELVDHLKDDRYAPIEVPDLISHAPADGETTDADQSVARVQAIMQGKTITLPDPDRLVTVTEAELDLSAPIDYSAALFEQEIQDAGENDLCVCLAYGSAGKPLYFHGEQEPTAVQAIYLLFDGAHDWLILEVDDELSAYELPDPIYRELKDQWTQIMYGAEE